ncbi:hypothetical protein Ddye_011682 [Dipteronia dyeriana]|uniref:Uncharacterized protein n=1 Tax=Dipteronia dyeriana TaxID=168575 RepID=A0AAD9X2Z2_9ROSI|nr:hypothetical protein Ddye_011682 [Dipteronia dyeriana]
MYRYICTFMHSGPNNGVVQMVHCYVYRVSWIFISIMKPNGILLLRVVESKSFSTNISLRKIKYHDQISNLPNVLVLPSSCPYCGMETPKMVFLTPTVINSNAIGRDRTEQTGMRAGLAATTTLKVLDPVTIMIPMMIKNNRGKRGYEESPYTTFGSSEALTDGGGGGIDFEIDLLRLENAQLKDKFDRICMIASRFLGFAT